MNGQGDASIDLTVILPVHNEAESIEKVVEEWLPHLEALGISFEILLCEDGSTDGTQEIARALAARHPQVKLDSVDYRRGYGPAIIEGYGKARGRYVLASDSDGQINPSILGQFWRLRTGHDAVMGVRVPRRDPLSRKIYSRLFYAYHRLLFATKLRDPSCPFVLIETSKARRMARLLSYMREGFWWGFVGAARKLGMTVAEVEVEHRERFAGTTRVYTLKKLPQIVLRNGVGLFRLRCAKT
jgi:glycosyltransferase involved in cell wall biosynthesis